MSVRENQSQTEAAQAVLPSAIMPSVHLWRSVTMDVPMLLAGEMSQFAVRRFQAQADHWSKVSHCNSLSDLMALQNSFTEAAIHDYADEANTLVKEINAVVPRPGA